VIRVDYARWSQTPEGLRSLALSAPHARTRARALFEITQGRCATRVAARTGRHPQTVLGWVHAYNAHGPNAHGPNAHGPNAHGPNALAFRRTGGRRPLFARTAQPNSARRSAPLSARPRRRPEPGLIQRRAGRCAALSLGPASGSG
jgi:Homeodomain-like domain